VGQFLISYGPSDEHPNSPSTAQHPSRQTRSASRGTRLGARDALGRDRPRAGDESRDISDLRGEMRNLENRLIRWVVGAVIALAAVFTGMLAANSARLDGAIAATSARLDAAIAATTTRLDSAIAANTERIDKLDAKIDALGARQDARMDRLDAKLDALMAELQSQRRVAQ